MNKQKQVIQKEKSTLKNNRHSSWTLALSLASASLLALGALSVAKANDQVTENDTSITRSEISTKNNTAEIPQEEIAQNESEQKQFNDELFRKIEVQNIALEETQKRNKDTILQKEHDRYLRYIDNLHRR